MAFRWINLVALGLALSSCSQVGLEGPSREYSGVWLYEFEGSTFIEGATEIPRERPPERKTDWLDYRVDAVARDDTLACHPIQPFLITFIGHRTQRPFGAGHLGLWRSQMTVHRTITLKRLGPAFCYGEGG